MTETEFTNECLTEARRLGLLAHHCPDSRRCKGNSGFPDLLLLGERGLMMPELKTADGDTSADQDIWIWTAHRASVMAPVWRPADMRSGAITKLMGRIR